MIKDAKISVRNISKIFGGRPEIGLEKAQKGWNRERILSETGNVLALNDVSFDIKEGEIFVVMGLSGSGKSTLIRCLNRLIEPTFGEVLIDGEDILKFDQKKLRNFRLHKIAMVFQHFALFPDRTVAQNVEFGLKLRGTSARERRDQAIKALTQVGLGEWADKFPMQLSGGMQQRVGLARSLAVEPDILLMDEAFSALDPLIRHDMQLELLKLQASMKRTVVFITHDLDEALLLGNRVAIIKEGSLVQLGTPLEILDSPADEYVASFVRDVNRGKVFSVKDVAEPGVTVSASTSVAEAMTLMRSSGEEFAVVLDEALKPLGVLRLDACGREDAGKAAKIIMSDQFAKVDIATKLVSVYPLFRDHRWVLGVDTAGFYAGLIDARKVMSRMANPQDSSVEGNPPSFNSAAE